MASTPSKLPYLSFFLLPIVFLFTQSQTTSAIAPRFPASILHSPVSVSASLDTKSNHDEQQLYREEFFTQVLDHFTFTPQSYQTFQQRYLINDTHWGGAKNKAPIFVYTGNEGGIEWFARNTGFMFDVAPRFNALLVFIEHRFYGKSIPFGGDAEKAYKDATTLGYLTSTQALADFATLIVDLKKNLSAVDSPVVVFGGSYGGMLAAWFRLKYPHVAIGALASSAPILDFDDLTSPYSFASIITRDFRSESESCYRVIKQSWDLITHTAKQPGGVDKLRSSFRLCKKEDVDSLTGWLDTAWVYTAMTDYPTPSNFLQPMPAYPVREMCKAIDDPKTGNDSFAKLFAAASVYYNHTGTAPACFGFGDDSFTQDLGAGGWGWQACTEMVMPQGACDEESMFPVASWSFDNSSCDTNYNIFPRQHWITTEFGGHKIKEVLRRYGSNIIFFNGLRDPWSGGGVLNNISSSIVAIVAEQGAHHVDLRSATSEDPEWLREVRRSEIGIIGKWLARYYHDLAHSRPRVRIY